MPPPASVTGHMLVSQRRILEPELMDQPGLDPGEHHHALTSLGRANAVSRTTATLLPAIRAAASARRNGPVRILDVACGGGQVAIELAERLGNSAQVTGCDMSHVALDYARALADRRRARNVEFTPLNVLSDAWPTDFDVVTCSLFLHHLTDDDAEQLMRRMMAAATHTVLISDLRRSNLGFVTAWVGCRLLSRSRVFHVDGTRSVRAAFRTSEALALAERAGMRGATMRHCWPQRFLLTWTRA